MRSYRNMRARAACTCRQPTDYQVYTCHHYCKTPAPEPSHFLLRWYRAGLPPILGICCDTAGHGLGMAHDNYASHIAKIRSLVQPNPCVTDGDPYGLYTRGHLPWKMSVCITLGLWQSPVSIIAVHASSCTCTPTLLHQGRYGASGVSRRGEYKPPQPCWPHVS
jgi:hypothetical protein